MTTPDGESLPSVEAYLTRPRQWLGLLDGKTFEEMICRRCECGARFDHPRWDQGVCPSCSRTYPVISPPSPADQARWRIDPRQDPE
jgi:hypothetical protein